MPAGNLTWLETFRRGFAPQLSNRALRSLADALRRDDPRLIQGRTTHPLPVQCQAHLPVEGCCPIAFCALSEGLRTVGEVEARWAELCLLCDETIGIPAASRWFLVEWDEYGADEVFPELLEEIEDILAEREAAEVPSLLCVGA